MENKQAIAILALTIETHLNITNGWDYKPNEASIEALIALYPNGTYPDTELVRKYKGE